MKNIRKIIVSIIAIGLLYSCTGDSIDLDPQGSISSDVVFKDPAFTNLYLNDIYKSLPQGFTRGWYMLSAATDDAENSYPWPASNTKFNTANLTPANSPFNGLWTNAYEQIRKLNLLAQNFDKIEGSEKDIAKIKAETHFLRAYAYSLLLRTFGGVPLITKPQELTEDLLVPRNTKEEVLKFIVSEYDAAAKLFKTVDATASTRGSWDAAMALKGRVLLYNYKYKESAKASKEVLDKTSRKLASDYQKIFLDDSSSEVIFDTQFKDPDRTHWANLFNTPKSSGGVVSGWGGTGPTQNLVDEYEMKDTGKVPAEAGSGYDFNAPYEGRDPRFYASILYDGSEWKGITIHHRPGGTEGIATSGDYTRTGYSLKKFMQEDRNHNNPSTQHWVYIRLAEVYLNYAEALIESNTNLGAAVAAINTVRQRSQMPPIAMGSQEDLRKKVRHERRIELAFEEHRFWDIRRWKIAGSPEVLTIYRVDMDENGKLKGTGKDVWEVRNWKDANYLMPIPQSEMDKNPNLKQNPGY